MNIRLLFLLLPLLCLTGCEGLSGRLSRDIPDDQEYILLKVNNYGGLLKLYRERLQQKEDPETRFKVAEYYYMLEDNESSSHFLAPLLASNPTGEVYLLESKNLMEMGKRDQALAMVEKAISIDANNGEAYNVKGMILSELGYFNEAIKSFNQARERFLPDNIVMNNIAMVYILKEDYNQALNYLMPIYTRGDKSSQLVHNLVLCLIKTHDYVRAEKVIREENIPETLEQLVEALRDVKAAVQENEYVPPKKQNEAVTVANANTLNRTQTGQGAGIISAAGNVNASAPTATNSVAFVNPSSNGTVISEVSTQMANNSGDVIPRASNSSSAFSLDDKVNALSQPVSTSQTSNTPPLAGEVPNSLIAADAPILATIVNNSPSPKSPVQSINDDNSEAKATISDVRMGNNSKGSRLVIESDKEIKFSVLSPKAGNELAVELTNYNQSNLLTNTSRYLDKRHRVVESITFEQIAPNRTKMTLRFKSSVQSKVYRMGPEDHYKDRVVIDLIY